MNGKLLFFTGLGVPLAFLSQAVPAAAPDWSKVPKIEIHVFHPGVTPIEWMTKRTDHSGADALKRGENCLECHDAEDHLSLDFKRLASKELEPRGAPKTMSFPVGIQAAYDKQNLFVRLTFRAPDGGADQSDGDNEVKASLLFANDQVPLGAQVGCWAACHADARTMPGGDEHKTKYVLQGAYDLMQWQSGKPGKAAAGQVTDRRLMAGGKAGVGAEGSKGAGNLYTVTFSRKFAGGVTLAEGKTVPFGVAIHADHAGGRFHHVSLGYRLGIGADGDVKATKVR